MNKNELLEILPELKKATDADPADFRKRAEYFWRLNDLEKIYLEENDYSNSEKIILEQNRYSEGINNSVNSIGWNIYKHLKSAENVDGQKVYNFINILTSIDFEKPSILYSQLAWILLKINNEETWFLEYFKSVGLNDFSQKDRLTSEFNGRKISPLEVRVVQKLAKIIEKNEISSEYEWILKQIESLLPKYPNEVWLKYHKGKLLLFLNKVKEARAMILEVLKKQKSQFWAWSFLGETFENENLDLTKSFLCKAVLLGNDEKMLLGTRFKLAQLLFREKDYSKAKSEILKVIEVRKNSGFKIGEDIVKISESKEIKEAAEERNMKEFYKSSSSNAEDIFLEQFNEAAGIVTNILKERNIAFIQFDKNKTASVKIAKSINLEAGDKCRIFYEEVNNRGEKKYNAVKYEKLANAEFDFVKEVKGMLKLHTSGNFGFIDNVFIHSSICSQLKDGNEVTILAVYEFNKKKNEYGWKGIKLIKN